MSRWGRAQDALFSLYEMENGYGPPDDGIVKQTGITFDQWKVLIEPILHAVAPIFSEPNSGSYQQQESTDGK